MKLFFAKKPKINVRPTDGKLLVSYKDIYTNVNLPFSHICDEYSRVKELDLCKNGLIIFGEDYSYQNGFDINSVLCNMYNRYYVKKIRFLNYFIDISIDCNKVSVYDAMAFIDVLKTDANANQIDIIFSNDDINFEFYITF